MATVRVAKCPIHGFGPWAWRERRVGARFVGVPVCDDCGARCEMVDMIPATDARQRRTRLGPDAMPPWFVHEVRARSHGRCVACGRPGRDPHHVLPQSKFPQARLIPDLAVLVCRDCHDAHENASRRIPRRALPPSTFTAAEQVGDPATAYIDRTYPADV